MTAGTLAGAGSPRPAGRRGLFNGKVSVFVAICGGHAQRRRRVIEAAAQHAVHRHAVGLFRHTLANQAPYRRLLGLFRDREGDFVARFAAALATDDRILAQRLAYDLDGASGTLGIPALAQKVACN